MDKFWQICQGAVTEGIDALIIHGRSVKELYRDKGDWEIISEVKRLISPDNNHWKWRLNGC